jgi:hypothetical protein
LYRLGFANEIADGGRTDQDFQCCTASFLVDPLKQVLRNHDPQRRRQGLLDGGTRELVDEHRAIARTADAWRGVRAAGTSTQPT